jgi:hypothetical protein
MNCDLVGGEAVGDFLEAASGAPLLVQQRPQGIGNLFASVISDGYVEVERRMAAAGGFLGQFRACRVERVARRRLATWICHTPARCVRR